MADLRYLASRAGHDTYELPDGDNREGFCLMTDDGPLIVVGEPWPEPEEDRGHPMWKFEVS